MGAELGVRAARDVSVQVKGFWSYVGAISGLQGLPGEEEMPSSRQGMSLQL